MAIEGPLRELGIHDVFQLLDLSRKTGRLRVSSSLRDNEGTVFFRDGRVVSAQIRSNPHALGTLLVRGGKITEQDLARARDVQLMPGEHRRLGEILVSLGLLTNRELERQVRQQIEVVVFELLSWQEGYFSFVEEDTAASAVDAAVSVTTEALLMEGARRLDEWTRVQQRIAHMGLVAVLAEPDGQGHAPALELLPHEWEVLAAIDGARDLRSVATVLGRSEFDVARVAFGLLTTGIIDVREPASRIPTAELAQSADEHMARSRDAITRESYEEAVAHAASAVAAAPDSADARLTLAKALQKIGRENEADEAVRCALVCDPRHAQSLMEMARSAMRRGELHAAMEYWDEVLAHHADTPLGAHARDARAHAARLAEMLEGVDA